MNVTVDALPTAFPGRRFVQQVENEYVPSEHVTLLFSDIVESTSMADRLGDRRWFELLRAHNALVRARAEAHGGIVAKFFGDGFMVAFNCPREAVECAMAIQRDLDEHGDPCDPVRVRIGLHAGEVLRVEDDYVGRNVCKASRLAGAAGPEEILVSSCTRELLAGEADLHFHPERELELKGLTGAHAAAPLEWRRPFHAAA